jgi:hypothetical protein
MHTQGLGYRIVKIDQLKRARVNRNATRRLHFGKHFAVDMQRNIRSAKRDLPALSLLNRRRSFSVCS